MPAKKIAAEPETVTVAEPVDENNEPLAAPPPPPRIKTTRAPVGIKTTERHTVERYSEPVAFTVETDEPDDDSGEVEIGPMGGASDDLAAPSLSAVDKLLQSLKDSSECVIYVQRRQDPPGFDFRTPAPQNISMGPLAWDGSFTCAEAIDSALQYAFGGGKYQLQLRVDNETRKQWTTIVADPPLRHWQRGHLNGGDMPVAQPLSGAATFKDQLKDVAEIITILNPKGMQHPAAPVDPATAVQQQFEMIGSVMRTVKDFLPEPPAPVAPVAGKGFLDTLLVNGFQFLQTPAGQQAAGTVVQGFQRLFSGVGQRANGSVPPAVAGGHLAPPQSAPPQSLAPELPAGATGPDLNDPTIRAQAVAYTQVQFVDRAIAGVKFDREPGELAQFVKDSLHMFPELVNDFGAWMMMDTAPFLAIMSQRAGEAMTLYPGAAAWLDDVKGLLEDSPFFAEGGEAAEAASLGPDGATAAPQFEMSLGEVGEMGRRGDGEVPAMPAPDASTGAESVPPAVAGGAKAAAE